MGKGTYGSKVGRPSKAVKAKGNEGNGQTKEVQVMHRKILEVATKLEQASKAHAGQAKVLRKIVDAKMSKQRKLVK